MFMFYIYLNCCSWRPSVSLGILEFVGIVIVVFYPRCSCYYFTSGLVFYGMWIPIICELSTLCR